MPPKKKVDLPDHVRDAVLTDVALMHEAAIQADESDKIRIFLATEQGLTTYELCERLGVSAQTVSNWAKQGREALKRREKERSERPSGDPDRPAELGAVG